MKKLSIIKKLSILAILGICVFLFVYRSSVDDAPSAAPIVHITAGRIEAGMTVQDVLVEVTIDEQPVACKLELTRFTGEGYYVMAEDEVVPEAFYGRLDVYYSLPKGVDLDSIDVVMECDGGEYDGTGSTSTDADGCVVAWSHAIYGSEPEAPIPLEVQITAGKIEAGMTTKDISVEVKIDGQSVAYEIELTIFTMDGFYILAEDEAVPEAFYGRLDVYYSLPKGVDLDSIDVVMECDGGEYDGTGSVSSDADGCIVAWSHAIYGSEPEEEPETESEIKPETKSEPTPEQKPETKPEPTPKPKPESKPETEQTHTHNWVEDTSKSGIVGCNFDGYKTYVCDCGETSRETIPATGHDYATTSTTEPTCTDGGYQIITCKLCGDGLINELPAAGHRWSEWHYENGRLHKRTCSVCNAEEEENHKIPTGTVKCSGCGQDIVN